MSNGRFEWINFISLKESTNISKWSIAIYHYHGKVFINSSIWFVFQEVIWEILEKLIIFWRISNQEWQSPETREKLAGLKNITYVLTKQSIHIQKIHWWDEIIFLYYVYIDTFSYYVYENFLMFMCNLKSKNKLLNLSRIQTWYWEKVSILHAFPPKITAVHHLYRFERGREGSKNFSLLVFVLFLYS